MELVDMKDLKSFGFIGCTGSSPVSGTYINISNMLSKDQTVLFLFMLPFAYLIMVFNWIIVLACIPYIILVLPLSISVLYATYIVYKNVRYHFPKIKI